MSRETDRRRWLTAYAPLIIWIFVILGLGSGIGASEETSRFIRPLLEFLFPFALPATISFYHGLIRKAAHFTEYGILAILAIAALRAKRGLLAGNFRLVLAFVLVLLVATADEFNQSFNPLRTGSTRDVLIDIAGGTTAIVICWLATRRR